MSMSHKAYAFDWHRFEGDPLYEILFDALVDGDLTELRGYIKANRRQLTDPYEGQPLRADWEEQLENRDVHEYGDYALTRFYDPGDDFGIWDCWRFVDRQLPKSARASTLGIAFGPKENYFDPGRQGSCFQPPTVVDQSIGLLRPQLSRIEEDYRESLARFLEGLNRSLAKKLGVYVTF